MNAREQANESDSIVPLIHCVRGIRVILDTDLAKLYGVPTFRLNEAIKRNRERFPEDFMFQLTSAERVYIIRAFVKMREEQAANAAILKRLAEIDRTLLQHDAGLRDIYQKLLPLLTPPPDPPRREIGFHIREKAVPYRVRRQATVRP